VEEVVVGREREEAVRGLARGVRGTSRACCVCVCVCVCLPVQLPSDIKASVPYDIHLHSCTELWIQQAAATAKPQVITLSKQFRHISYWVL